MHTRSSSRAVSHPGVLAPRRDRSALRQDPRLGGGRAAPSGSTSALERDVPEQRRGEREHAADVLPGGRRRDELAPQGVGDVVVRELLDLLGELLAPGGIGLRDPVSPQLLPRLAAAPAEECPFTYTRPA